MSKTAIVVFSDPKTGGDDALGRLFNAMVLALELKEKKQDVALIFQGAGTRWPAEIVQPTHPLNALYDAVQDTVAGVCGGCADFFGAGEGARATGLKMVHEKAVPGTSGMLDLSRYLDQGYQLATF